MDLKIKASENFLQVLEKYSDKITVKKKEEVSGDGTYNADFKNLALNLSLNLVISVFAPFITDAIKEYVNTTNESIVVTTADEKYHITPSNVNELTLILHKEILVAITEEKNGKIW